MAKLSDHFERIYIINLPYRPDRRERIAGHLEELGLASPDEIVWSKAISGDMCPPPPYFRSGAGAWGCLHSHLRLVQEAVMDGLESYLVLEDDAVFHSHSPEHLQLLMNQLPPDWGQLYLGGQHWTPPQSVEDSPFIFRGTCIYRTHAYALHRRAMAVFQQHIANAPDYIEHGAWHVDHQLGLAHERRDWKTYAPAWWLAGQEDGGSNISGRTNPRFWWFSPQYSGSLPFIHLASDPEQAQLPQLHNSVHFGNHLKPGSFQDVALDSCVDNPEELKKWLSLIAGEALDRGLLPGIQHPRISRDDVAACWSSGTHDATDADLVDLLNYPYNGLFEHSLNLSL